MKRGEFGYVTYNSKTLRMMIVMASPNEVSVMICFDGALHASDGSMFAGSMPLLRDDAGVYRDLIHGEPAVISTDQEHREARP